MYSKNFSYAKFFKVDGQGSNSDKEGGQLPRVRATIFTQGITLNLPMKEKKKKWQKS